MLVPGALGAVLGVGVAELTPQSLGSTVSTWVNAPIDWQTGGTHRATLVQAGNAVCAGRRALSFVVVGRGRDTGWRQMDR